MYLITKEKDGKLVLRVDCPSYPVVGEREIRAIRNALIQLHLGFHIFDDITTLEQRYDFLTPIAHLFAVYDWEEHGSSSPGWLTRLSFNYLISGNDARLDGAERAAYPLLEGLEPETGFSATDLIGEVFLGVLLIMDPIDPTLRWIPNRA